MTTPSATAPRLHERLVPGPGAVAAAFGLGLFVVLATLPLGVGISLGLAVAATVGALVLLWLTSPVVSVDDAELRAGSARIPLAALGEARAVDRDGLRHELGRGLDARAYVCHRPWARAAVRVPIVDPADPTPYWLVSTRRPDALADAIDAARGAVAGGAAGNAAAGGNAAADGNVVADGADPA
ncbi:DUF3093 domain-containing protein [Sediminihabitans luteus]|nr:DUF3093 domain-containing protein [Sediminihabitans luteus]